MARPDEDFEPFMAVPPHLCERPPIADRLPTETSHIQERTIKECLPFLTAVNDPSSNPFDFDEHGVRFLQRQTHVDFVHNGLEPLPAQFVAIDASRPWLMYWSLLSLYIMGEDVTTFRSRYVESAKTLTSKPVAKSINEPTAFWKPFDLYRTCQADLEADKATFPIWQEHMQ